MEDFSFKKLFIWQEASSIGLALHILASELKDQHHFRYSEQLKGASLSITNNIAEGAGSATNKEYLQFLIYSRRSIYECANILAQLELYNTTQSQSIAELNKRLVVLTKRLNAFMSYIKSK